MGIQTEELMLRKSNRNANNGFTLIELMIVIAIIGILAAIAIPNFLAYRTKAQDMAAVNEGKNFYNTAMAYFANDTYTGTSLGTAGAPSHTYDPNITIGGSSISENGGVISTNLTFSHSKSSVVFTLTTGGKLTE